mgnify:CR=1 FL=1
MPTSSAFGGVDINLFPEAMIRSVETTTGGASAALIRRHSCTSDRWRSFTAPKSSGTETLESFAGSGPSCGTFPSAPAGIVKSTESSCSSSHTL